MKPYLKKEQSSISSLQLNTNYKVNNWNSSTSRNLKQPSIRRKRTCLKRQKLSQSSFNLSSATLSSSLDDISNQYKRNKERLTITKTVKEQFYAPQIVPTLCKIQAKAPQQQQLKYVQRQVQTTNKDNKIFRVIDFVYEPTYKQCVKPSWNSDLLKGQHELKRQGIIQDSLFGERTKSTSVINQSNEESIHKIGLPHERNQKDSLKLIDQKPKQNQIKISKKEIIGKKMKHHKSNRTNEKTYKRQEKYERANEQIGFNLEEMRNCKCCGKLVTKLCFRCPHIYCNADNCSRKKKQLLNERMLQKMKEDKIQQHYRQREVFQQKFKLGSTPKVKQQLKFFNRLSSEEDEQLSDQDSNATNQLCQQSSQDESSEKTLMFLKKNQKTNKKTKKIQKRESNKKESRRSYQGGIIKRKKNQSDDQGLNQSSKKRNLRKTKKAEIFQDSNE